MVNKPKNIGTHFETGLARYLQSNGFPQAERRSLHGLVDLGDITGTPDLVWEQKGGGVARGCGPKLLVGWMAETEAERINAGADVGILVVQRAGYGVSRAGMWHSYWRADALVRTVAPGFPPQDILVDPATPVRLDLADTVAILRAAGYGEPL